MAKHVVGIDIAASGVRVVRLSHGSRRTTCTGFGLAEAPPDADFRQLAALARTVVDAEGLEGGSYILGLPAHRAFLRRFCFPFSSSRKIDQVIAYEIESRFPVPMERVVVASRKAHRKREGPQAVLAAALETDLLAELLKAFEGVGLPPSEVTLGIDALEHLARSMDAPLPLHCLWLDVGLRRTQVLQLADGSPVCCRSIPCVWPEPVWREQDNLATETPPRSWRGTSQALVSEIIATVLAASPDARRLPELTIITGEQAGHGEVLGALCKHLPGEVKRLRDFSWERLGLEPAFRSRLDQLAVALGLALRGAEGGGSLNYLRGEFAVKALSASRRRPRLVLAAAFALALASAGLSVGLDMRAKTLRLEALENQAREMVRGVAPDIASDLTLRQDVAIIKDRLEKLKEKQLIAGQKAPETNLVETLRLLSSLLTGKDKVAFRSLQYDETRITIRAEAGSFQAIEKIKSELAALDLFQSIQIKDIKTKSNGSDVEFGFELFRRR